MSKSLYLPEGYKPLLSLRETQHAIKYIKDIFQQALSFALTLDRVSAPLIVEKGNGINDDLNGVERKVDFTIKELDKEGEVVQSLAKWKRMALYRYGYEPGEGIYTDMNAIRRDDDTDNTHSIFVDQWDWEKVITAEQRNIDFLKETVKYIVKAIHFTKRKVSKRYPQLKEEVCETPFFITTQELEDMYPDKTPDNALEVSSMGIRVDANALQKQLKELGAEDRNKYAYHKMIAEGTLPLTIGGGIGQSRLCMYMLEKAHIGEVQSSLWPDEMSKKCAENGIVLL